jgi:hypothetical protein
VNRQTTSSGAEEEGSGQYLVNLQRAKVMEILFFLLPFIVLVFVALTYDKTVTPTVNWFRRLLRRLTNSTLASQREQSKTTRSFNLFDSAFIILPFALIFVTYEAFDPAKSFHQKLVAIPSIALVWILILFKIHRIEVIDSDTIIFRGLFRRIKVTPQDILSVQDWLRGIRIILKEGSIVLWPFIENQGEFKALLRGLNPDIEMRDMSNEATESTARGGLIILGMFIYFALLIWLLFTDFTQHIK